MRTNQLKVGPSRPVTQTEQRRSKVGHGETEGALTTTSVKEMMDLEQCLDESCCWNEIPVKTQSHSKANHSEQKQNSMTGTETLEFDLNDMMLRTKHRSQGGVAMVTVRLRKQRNQHNSGWHAQAQLECNSPF